MKTNNDIIDRIYSIRGLVQGVGFRPYVSILANKMHISGSVRNSGGRVTIHAVGRKKTVEDMLCRLLLLDGENCDLPAARVDEIIPVSDGALSEMADGGFFIEESEIEPDEIRFLPPDIATCNECERELFDESDRRYKNPFISCVSCGPRYTITRSVPYDRANTTMADFALCDECKKDYAKKKRRIYAQTISCNDCGPRLYGREGDQSHSGDDAIKRAVEILKSGGIVAIKDIGGYHLACRMDLEGTIKRLREFKQRGEKPFAIMYASIDEIKKNALVTEEERVLLESDIRPIVLLHDREGYGRRIGAILPCNPIQLLIMREMGSLVMTSANRGGNPIITDDDEMLRLADEYNCPDYVLCHDREILQGLDDSIYQVISLGADENIVQIIRRARGLVPAPVMMKREVRCDTFAAGGDLKNSFALARQNYVFMGGHFGDIENLRSLDRRNGSITHMESLLGIEPERYICDRHPGYYSVRDAAERSGAKQIELQHHFAHILSVAAENHIEGELLGIAYDGTGYGDDGSIWGGELLLCSGRDYRRAAHLYPVYILGGDTSAYDAISSAIACLICMTDYDEITEKWHKAADSKERYRIQAKAISQKINVVKSSSMGRVFDAAAAILDICYTNSYEGECAMMLQECAESYYHHNNTADCRLLKYEIEESWGSLVINTPAMLFDLLCRRAQGEDTGRLSYIFHETVAEATAVVCKRIFEQKGKAFPIALSGGCMQNGLFLGRLIEKFKCLGYDYYLNREVPPGDGGLALGQAFYAAM